MIDKTAPRNFLRQTVPYLPIVCWAIVFAVVAAAIQLAIPYPLDADTAYHAAVGQLISRHGILYAFPWTPYSWLADHYADKELIFHLLFVPLSGVVKEWTGAARIIGTLGGTAILLSLYLIVRAEKVKAPGLWALVTLAASFEFLFRFALVRPFLFSIALALVVLWSASRHRLLILAGASFLYPWAYVAWHLPIILAGIAAAADYLSSRRISYRPLLVSCVGIAAGLLLHPNTMNLIRMTWLEIVRVLFRNAWENVPGLEMGLELSPAPLHVWTHSFVLIVLMAAFALYFAWCNRRQDAVPLVFALTALAFGILTIKTYKFVEYFVPFSVVAFALSTRLKAWRFLPHLMLFLSLFYTLSLNIGNVLALTERVDDMPPESLHFLQRAIPPGSQVFSPDWRLTGTLMLALPERRFIVALNPSYFFENDPELYRLWYQIPREPAPDSAELIRRRFKARYVLCANMEEWRPLMRELALTPGVRSFITDNRWVLFDLNSPGSP